MNVLMVGVDKNRVGGMWTVAETYINDIEFNKKVKLYYIATSTCGSILKRIMVMLSGYIQILFVLLFTHIDIVHIHMAERGSTFRKGFIIWISKRMNKPVVIQLHAGPFMDWYFNTSIKNQSRIRGIFDNADRILVLGEYWKKQMKELVNEDKLTVLYNGSECPSTNCYNVDGNNILYLGLLKKTKGIYDLLLAISYIDSILDENISVYLCGTDEEGDIADKIKEYGLEDRVKMMGWISKSERLKLFKNTVLCVLPSYFEALSMTVIESMCYGIPILTTNISTMPELVGNDIPLFEPGDYKALGDLIIQLLNDKRQRITCSEALYKRAKKKFSIAQNICATLSVYEEVINNI